MGVGIEWDTAQVAHLEADLSKAPAVGLRVASQAIRKTAMAIEADGKTFCPVDTGNLRGSISSDIAALEATIGPTADYGLYVEMGVPHSYIIRARDGGFLRFVVDGHVVYTRQVVHPPSAPQPYMRPAADRNIPTLEQALQQVGGEIL